MKRLTYDFCIGGNHCWQVKGADNLECREVCERQGDDGCKTCPIAKAFGRLAAIEDILGDEYDLDLVQKLIQAYREGRYIILKEPEQAGISRLRELAQADREGRCVVLPKDGMVYYIEETGGEKWIANKPIQQITVKCGWGIASLEFSLFDTGKYFTSEAAEAALKGEQNGKNDQH